MTRKQAWDIWYAILDELKENGHELSMSNSNECGGTYVDVIMKVANQQKEERIEYGVITKNK